MRRVLFVCLGNICRSPAAEAVVRRLAQMESEPLALELDSAGTSDYHVGAQPDPRMVRAGEAAL
jgi:protein-tyrosine phosphatase